MEILAFLLIILLIVFYFLPAIVACNRNHPQGGSIFLLNLLLGWTLLGWVIAIVWAVSNSSPQNNEQSIGDVASQLERLHKLKDQGIITEEEFNTQKAKLLG